jgi:hypothetical protein
MSRRYFAKNPNDFQEAHQMNLLKQIDAEIKKLTSRIAALESARKALVSSGGVRNGTPGRKKGTKLSPAARKKMSDAAKKRWAKKKAAV